MAPRKPTTTYHIVTIRLAKEERDAFKILAVKKGLSMTDLLRSWLEKALKTTS